MWKLLYQIQWIGDHNNYSLSACDTHGRLAQDRELNSRAEYTTKSLQVSHTTNNWKRTCGRGKGRAEALATVLAQLSSDQLHVPLQYLHFSVSFVHINCIALNHWIWSSNWSEQCQLLRWDARAINTTYLAKPKWSNLLQDYALLSTSLESNCSLCEFCVIAADERFWCWHAFSYLL